MKRILSAVLAGALLAGIGAGATNAFLTTWLAEPVETPYVAQPRPERGYVRYPQGWPVGPAFPTDDEQEISTDDDE